MVRRDAAALSVQRNVRCRALKRGNGPSRPTRAVGKNKQPQRSFQVPKHFFRRNFRTVSLFPSQSVALFNFFHVPDKFQWALVSSSGQAVRSPSRGQASEWRHGMPAARLRAELLFVPYRNGIIKLNIYFQEYNYRTISESAATTVSAHPCPSARGRNVLREDAETSHPGCTGRARLLGADQPCPEMLLTGIVCRVLRRCRFTHPLRGSRQSRLRCPVCSPRFVPTLHLPSQSPVRGLALGRSTGERSPSRAAPQGEGRGRQVPGAGGAVAAAGSAQHTG